MHYVAVAFIYCWVVYSLLLAFSGPLEAMGFDWPTFLRATAVTLVTSVALRLLGWR